MRHTLACRALGRSAAAPIGQAIRGIPTCAPSFTLWLPQAVYGH
jgi:hypothetical protein